MIYQTTLPNGIRVIVEPVENTPKIAVRCSMASGSKNDPRELAGLAHFLEHTLFLGTETLTESEIRTIEKQTGSSFEMETGKEEIDLYTEVLPDDFSLTLKTFADMIQHPAFPEKLIAREKEIILTEEQEGKTTQEDVADNMYWSAAYKKNSPLGHPTIGTQKTIRAISVADLKDFYQTYFRPENLIISVAGQITPNECFRKCTALFKDFTNKTAVPEQKPSPYLGGECRYDLDDDIMNVRLGFDSVSLQFQQEYLKSELFATIMEAALFDEIRTNQGLVYEITADSFHFQNSGTFRIDISCETPKAEKVLKEVCRVIHKVKTNMTEDDLKIAKKRLYLSLLSNIETLEDRADMNLNYLRCFNKTYQIDKEYATLDSITLDDLKTFAQNIFASRLTYSCVGNIRKIPTYEQMSKWLSQTNIKAEGTPLSKAIAQSVVMHLQTQAYG